jgi:L-aspartate oxidase
MSKSDVIIAGSGIAGCITAIKLFDKGVNVILLTKENDEKTSNTYYAQGGIIYKGETDSWDILKQDIMYAGGGLSKEDAVGVLCDYGPSDVKDILINRIGVPFVRDSEGKLDMTSEGAHSRRRIIHCKDKTGRVILECLHQYIKTKTKIKILNNTTVLDVITAENIESPDYKYGENRSFGVYVLDNKTSEVKIMRSDFVVLATGGCGSIYQNTTNPESTVGDGYAVAQRAGVKLINMEYTQFHPTTLYHASGDRFLISESLRGEGAVIKTQDGNAFMIEYHKMRDLAPRDIVTRSILFEMNKKGLNCVFLDCSKIGEEKLKKRFPNIYSTCLEKYHFDITKSWIPITPAFHFMCGGIKTDTYGRTELKNLYAVGECACTGLHGANRLASTSLLEGVVFGVRAAEDIAKHLDTQNAKMPKISPWKFDNKRKNEVDKVILKQTNQMLKSIMWNYVGPERSYQRLKLAAKLLTDISESVEELFREHRIDKRIVELRNAIQTGISIARAAWNNKKSLGCHYITD